MQVRRPTYKPKKNKVNWMGDFAPLMDGRCAVLVSLHMAASQSYQEMRSRGFLHAGRQPLHHAQTSFWLSAARASAIGRPLPLTNQTAPFVPLIVLTAQPVILFRPCLQAQEQAEGQGHGHQDGGAAVGRQAG